MAQYALWAVLPLRQEKALQRAGTQQPKAAEEWESSLRGPVLHAMRGIRIRNRQLAGAFALFLLIMLCCDPTSDVLKGFAIGTRIALSLGLISESVGIAAFIAWFFAAIDTFQA